MVQCSNPSLSPPALHDPRQLTNLLGSIFPLCLNVWNDKTWATLLTVKGLCLTCLKCHSPRCSVSGRTACAASKLSSALVSTMILMHAVIRQWGLLLHTGQKRCQKNLAWNSVSTLHTAFTPLVFSSTPEHLVVAEAIWPQKQAHLLLLIFCSWTSTIHTVGSQHPNSLYRSSRNSPSAQISGIPVCLADRQQPLS